MLFSCWQKDTTTRPYRPYRAVLLFSNTKRRVILRMRSDAFQSACDAASTKNKRMATQTNAVKSLSDEVDFSLSGSKCTVSARFLHGFKTCKGCKSLQNRTKGAETRSSKPAMYRKEITIKRNFQKLRESPGVRYESVGRGFESLPSHQEKPEHVCVLVFLFVSTMEGARTGWRRIAPQAISPVGCCLARGFQHVGMSTVEAVKSKDFMAFLFCKPWVRGCGKSETYPQKIQDGKDGISY